MLLCYFKISSFYTTLKYKFTLKYRSTEMKKHINNSGFWLQHNTVGLWPLFQPEVWLLVILSFSYCAKANFSISNDAWQQMPSHVFRRRLDFGCCDTKSNYELSGLAWSVCFSPPDVQVMLCNSQSNKPKWGHKMRIKTCLWSLKWQLLKICKEFKLLMKSKLMD